MLCCLAAELLRDQLGECIGTVADAVLLLGRDLGESQGGAGRHDAAGVPCQIHRRDR